MEEEGVNSGLGVGVGAGPTFLSNPGISPGWDANPHPPRLPPSPLQRQRWSRREETAAAPKDDFLIPSRRRCPGAYLPSQRLRRDSRDDSIFFLILPRAFFAVVLGALEIVLVLRAGVASGFGVAGRR